MTDLRKIREIALADLKDFKGAIEIADFERFLLLNFASHSTGPAGIMSILGIGERSGVTISYDPMRELYFYKILGGNQEMNQIYIYCKHEPVINSFFTKDPVGILKKYIPMKELELLGIGTKKKKMIQIRATDFMLLNNIKNGKKIKLEIDLVYIDLQSFIIGYEEKSRIFLVERDDYNLAFNVNFSPLLKIEDSNLMTIDLYFDKDKELSGHKYVSIDKDSKIKFTDEVDEKNIQQAIYCLVVPVKSFELPE
ncbi:MAG: hypothetical protein ACTSWN_00455 [Promethearchaeota archaeon]